jgi:hypothetical protein
MKRREFALMAAGIAVGFLPNLTHLYYPFSGDHLIHGWVGNRLTMGELPYVDHVTHNFPGGAMLYAAATLILGEDAFGYRFMEWCWQLAAGVLMFTLARRLAGPWAGLTAMILHGLTYGALNCSTAGNRDPMLALLYLLTITLVSRRSPRGWGWIVGIGLISGFLFLIKPTHGIWWLAVAGWMAVDDRGKGVPVGAVLRRLAVFGLACVAPTAAIAAGYAIAGHWRELIDCTIRFNLAYGSSKREMIFIRPFHLIFGGLSIWGLLRTFLDRSDRPLSILAGLWLACAFVGAWVQGKYLAYQLTAITAAASLWAAIGVVFLASDVARLILKLRRDEPLEVPLHRACLGDLVGRLIANSARICRRFGIVGLVVSISAAGIALRYSQTSFPLDIRKVTKHWSGEDDLRELRSHFDGRWEAAYRVVDFVQVHSAPSDTVLSFDYTAFVMFMSGRKSPSRFDMPRMIFPFDPSSPEADVPDGIWSRWREEFVASVIEAPPKLIVLNRRERIGGWENAIYVPDAIRTNLPRIQQLLEDRYRVVETIGDYDVYKRLESLEHRPLEI